MTSLKPKPSSHSSSPSGAMMRLLPRRRIVCGLLMCSCLAVILWLTFEQGRDPAEDSVDARWLHAKIIPEMDVEHPEQNLHVVLVKDDDDEGQEKRGMVQGFKMEENETKKKKKKKEPSFSIDKPANKTSKKGSGHKKKKSGGKKEKLLLETEDLGLNEQEAETWLRENIKNGYCNPTNREITGEEGNYKPGLELKVAYVFVRHGDRTPIFEFSHIPNTTWHPKWNCDLKEATRTMKSEVLAEFVRTMEAELATRKGDMNDVAKTFRVLPLGNHGTCQRAELTPTGWLQHLELGRFFRRVYGHALVDSPEQLANISVFKSTVNSRTQQSAFAFMYSFLRHAALKDTYRIKTVANVNFCPLDMCTCPALERLIKDKEGAHSKFMRGNANFVRAMKSIAQTLYGKPQTSLLPGINSVAEILATLVCHNLPYPYGHYGAITPIQHAAYHKHLEEGLISQMGLVDGTFEKLGRMFVQPLLTDMAKKMFKYGQAIDTKLFVLNSGHDVTLRPIADGLQLTGPGWPHYAARIVFELWNKPGSRDNYIRVLAFGKDQTSNVRFCRDKMTRDGLCPLSALQTFVGSDNLAYFYADTYEDACMVANWQH